MEYNTACVLFGVSSIEACINEWVSIAAEIEDADISIDFWKELGNIQKSLSIRSKWNLIVSVSSGTKWDSSRDPFQSFESIAALRNELIHFKGELLGKDEAPNRKIKGLLSYFGLKSEATFVEGDVSSWVADLLAHKEVGKWVYEKIDEFYNAVVPMLLNKR